MSMENVVIEIMSKEKFPIQLRITTFVVTGGNILESNIHVHKGVIVMWEPFCDTYAPMNENNDEDGLSGSNR